LKEKTVTISFRVNESAFKALQEEAKKRNISLNTLANQMFIQFAEYDRFLDRFRMVRLSTPTLKRIINAATDDKIIDAGRQAGGSVPESFILAKSGEITLSSILEYLRLMGAHANLFDYSDIVHSGRNSVTLTHDLGVKGSLFLANYVRSILQSIDMDGNVMQYPDAITIEI
jgi:hypothetical protein